MRARDWFSSTATRWLLLALLLPLALSSKIAWSQALRGPGESDESAQRGQESIPLRGPSDSEIQRRLKSIFSQVESMASFDVEVRSGVVRLSGESHDLDSISRAAELAQRLEGVVYVKNEISQISDVRSRLGPAWTALKHKGKALLRYLPLLALAILTFLAFLWLSRWAAHVDRPFRRLGLSGLGTRLARMAVRAVLILVGLLFALEILGVTGIVAAVVGTLGLIGLAAGLIFKDWAGNYIPGMMLGLKPPFKSGDLVQIGDQEGRIVRITARDTVLITTDGEQLRIPNSRVLEKNLLNFSRHSRRRLRVPLVLGLDADLRETRDRGVEALLGVPGALRDPAPFMRTKAIFADRIEVEFYAWIDQDAVNFRNAESRARRAITEALLSAGVRFPTFMVGIARPPEKRPRAPSGAEPEPGDGLDDEFLKAQVLEEQRTSDERDLLEEAAHGLRGVEAHEPGAP